MEFLQNAVMSIIPFIIVIGVVVVVHEFGHFMAARSVGIRVDRFSVGYPPRIFGKKFGDTDYCISLLPLGGYVKMAGMIDESMDNPEKITGASDEFMSKNFIQKAWVISAGVIMNFVLAWVIYTGIIIGKGIPEVIDPIVQSLSPDFPAAAAGVEPGDKFVSINGDPTETWDELVEVVHGSANVPLQFVWDRDGELMNAEITPLLREVPDDGEMVEVGLIGITPLPSHYRSAGVGEAISVGGQNVWTYLKLGATTIKMLATREAGVKDLGGPVLIGKWAKDSAKGGPEALMLFIAFISINIGFLNILPIPVLDGGHLLLIILEAVARRPIPTKVKLGIQQVGMIALLGLMAVIIWNDIGRVRGGGNATEGGKSAVEEPAEPESGTDSGR